MKLLILTVVLLSTLAAQAALARTCTMTCYPPSYPGGPTKCTQTCF